MAKKTKSTRTGKPKGPDPHWKLVEKVVALIEKALSPRAEVKHNQWLRNITTGHRRQCDVVIREGTAARPLITIVEVQRRDKKVTTGDLGNWFDKMRSVGAQRLICVSGLDFSQPVKDDVAMRYGPAVVLVRLRDLQNGALPPGILHSTMLYRVPEVIRSLAPHKLIYAEEPKWPGGNRAGNEMRFFIGESDEPLKVNQLFEEYFGRKPCPLPAGVHSVETEVAFEDPPVWSVYAGMRQRVLRLISSLEIKMHSIEVPLSRTVIGIGPAGVGGVDSWRFTRTRRYSHGSLEADG